MIFVPSNFVAGGFDTMSLNDIPKDCYFWCGICDVLLSLTDATHPVLPW